MAAENNRARDQRQTRRTLYGVLLILAVVASAMLVFFLDDILNAFERRYEIVALVPDAPGVADGTPVWVSGRQVGVVTAVAILPSSVDTMGRVAVTMELPVRVQQQVRRDSRVRLTSVSMISEAVLDILPGSPAEPPMADGDTLRTAPRQSADALRERAAIIRADLDSVMATVETLTPLLSQRIAATQRAFAGLDGAMAEARRIQADLQANPGYALLNDPAFQQSLARARSHVAAMPGMIEQLRDRAGQGSELASALARLQARADSVQLRLATAAALLEDQQGTLGRMQNDSALVRAINAARASMDSLMMEVRGNPLRFVF